MLAMNYRVAELSKRERAMLDFTWKLAASPAEIEESDRDNLRSAGFEDREILDIAAVASFFSMSTECRTRSI